MFGDPEAPTCAGFAATIVGTGGPDQLTGTPQRDVVSADAGDDVIVTGLGKDVVCGGPGSDSMAGGMGVDTMQGGPGSDLIHGNRQNDLLDGGPDADAVLGDLGDDRVRGGDGDRDEVAGGLGIDVVNGGPGGGDVVSGDYGYDRMIGGPGFDDVASFETEVSDRFGTGIHASLASKRARGDGKDVLLGFEALQGSAMDDVLIGNGAANRIFGGLGDDRLHGGGGEDVAYGGQGSDRCGRFTRRSSCGLEERINAGVFARIMPSLTGGGGSLVVLQPNPGEDRLAIAFDAAAQSFRLDSSRAVAIGPGCARVGQTLTAVDCRIAGRAGSLVVDLGHGDDRLRLSGDLVSVGQVRASGGADDDVLRGGPADDLLEAGAGDDVIYGGGGSDGLIGGLHGADRLFGGPDGDLIAAGSACEGGALIGGGGRDNASFAETLAHPGVLFASLKAGIARIAAVPGCDPVRLDPSNEDLEGSFDYDILVGDASGNAILGQPGLDRFFGGAGDDDLNLRDGERDGPISCGAGDDVIVVDGSDPRGDSCETRRSR